MVLRSCGRQYSLNLCLLKRKVVQGGSANMTYFKNSQMITVYPKRAVLVLGFLCSAFPFICLKYKQEISDVSTTYALPTTSTLF